MNPPEVADVGVRICPFCESTCGLRITFQSDLVERVEGNADDLFSRGYLCPKGANLARASNDPDRLRVPMVRDRGEFREATWSEAFARIRAGIARVRREHGNDAIGMYVGNPNSHNLAAPLYLRYVIKAAGSKNLFSPATADQVPTQVACARVYGSPRTVPVPDIDRAECLVVFGANPLASNGSLCTAPNFPERLRKLRERGGKLIVVDPRTTGTAELADRHLAIRPATDVWLLLAVVKCLLEADEPAPAHLRERIQSLDALRDLAAKVEYADSAARCGVEVFELLEVCQTIAKARVVAAYGRIGTCTVEHGTLTNWLIQCVNVLTGSLDTPGGAMFPISPVRPRRAAPVKFRTGRWTSRVRGLSEIFGEFPVSTLADEVLTPGLGQIRALVTVAGNPVLSTPQGDRLADGLADLDFMVSVDPYLNETTEHAQVVLPPPPLLSTGHFDWALAGYSVRPVVRYSRALRPVPHGMLSDEETLYRLAMALRDEAGEEDGGADFREQLLLQELGEAVRDPKSAVHGRDLDELRAQVNGLSDSERRLDVAVRLGPFGDGFGMREDGITLQHLLDHPEGIDFGPMVERLDEVLAHPDGTIDLFPSAFVDEVEQLLSEGPVEELVLVGRRQLRSNNSWLHNVPQLVVGRYECTLQMSERDADERGLAHGEEVRVSSRVGSVVVVLEVTRSIRQGVVSLPHGWGHLGRRTRARTASKAPGANVNQLVDPGPLDRQSGAAVMNGIPVWVTRLNH
ncbi:molybdopterin oxidoreductase family protein [Rhodococcus olei]|uniref:Molybdopterin oxidoreductase family protein n=1 Tax=Rhodococcus olei TaxID=2161675 RepID=A0ABP8NYW5_9NOCA